MSNAMLANPWGSFGMAHAHIRTQQPYQRRFLPGMAPQNYTRANAGERLHTSEEMPA